MTEQNKKYFFKQIILFNKNAYLGSACLILTLIFLLYFIALPSYLFYLLLAVLIGTIYFSISSILFSYFIYDRSDLYKFNWLKEFNRTKNNPLINVYSGYTEAGHLLEKIFVGYPVYHFDFFDIKVSVTKSIQKAKALSPKLINKDIKYNKWESDLKADTILFMQSLHELREENQQSDCLREAYACLRSEDSRIVVVEHLCDLKNLLIYSWGALHFFGEKRWKNVFNNSALKIEKEFNLTPFIKVFVLKK
jgi:hypothetical protein